MINLRKRDVSTVEFRRDLPAFLADGKPCYIQISARAAGGVNPEYMAGLEENMVSAKVMDRKAAKIDDDEAFVKASRENSRRAARQRVALLYDACVIEWQSNVIDGDGPIACDRERFIALAEVRGVPELTKAIQDFEAECIEAGKQIAKDDEDAEKN